jgi:outer membrane immunogenic protein
MYKKMFLAAVSLLAISSSAFAADRYDPVTDWSGFYIGVVGTGGMFINSSDDSWCYTACDAPELSSFGFGVGGTIGYNHQISNMLIGIEADMSWTDFSNSESYNADGGGGWEHSASWDYYGTARARMGYSLGEAMIFATAGVAWADWETLDECSAPHCAGGPTAAFSEVEFGFTVGGGMEYALSDALTLKGEYLYIGMPSNRVSLSGGNYVDQRCDQNDCDVTVNSSAQVARVGLNYRF